MKRKLLSLFLTIPLAFIGWISPQGVAQADTSLRTVQIVDTIWSGSPEMPSELAHTSYDFVVVTAQVIHGEDMEFINYAGTSFVLKADGRPDVYANLFGGFSTRTISGFGFEASNLDAMQVGVPYTIQAPEVSDTYRWDVLSGVTVVRQQKSEPAPIGDVPWIEAGITHTPNAGGFRTYVDRAKLPAEMQQFSRIRVTSSDRPFRVRENGDLQQYTDFSEPYQDREGYGSGLPRPGTVYALTILYDAAYNPLGFREDTVLAGGGGSTPGGTPQQPQTPRNPTDYGADIDPNYNQPTRQLFSDVPSDFWANSAIADLSTRGVLGGYPDGKFRPDRIVTRAELAKIMVLAAGLDVQKVEKTSFADVKPDDWHAPYVEAAKFYLNACSLPDGSIIFDPDAPALREDLAVAIVKLKGYDSIRLPDLSIIQAMFTDYSGISSSARNYVAIAVESKLVSGFPDDTFRAQQPVNRAQAAAMLSRAYQYGNDTKLEQQTDRVKIEFPMTPSPGQTPVQVPVYVPVPVPTTVTENVYQQP